MLQSRWTKCDTPRGLFLNKLKASHVVFRARDGAAYHGAEFEGISNSQIPSRRTLAEPALAVMGTEGGRGELGVGWMLALLGVLAVGSWQVKAGQGRAGQGRNDGGGELFACPLQQGEQGIGNDKIKAILC